MIKTVGIDADDTLWDEASLFEAGEATFVAQIEAWTHQNDVRDRLRELHFALIGEVGYGPAGYRKALWKFSEIHLEPDLRSRAGALANEVCDWIEGTRVTPLDGVVSALDRLRAEFKLVVITKGDLAWQTRKLDHSGLVHLFDAVYVVAEKNHQIYADIFGANVQRPHAAMIGNSVKSDILPAMSAGAFGLHVPFHRTSPLESVEWSEEHALYRQFPNLDAAANWLLSYGDTKSPTD